MYVSLFWTPLLVLQVEINHQFEPGILFVHSFALLDQYHPPPLPKVCDSCLPHVWCILRQYVCKKVAWSSTDPEASR